MFPISYLEASGHHCSLYTPQERDLGRNVLQSLWGWGDNQTTAKATTVQARLQKENLMRRKNYWLKLISTFLFFYS